MTRLTRDQFARLVREHHAAVYRSARRFVGDGAAAADVAQEVFLRALHGKVRLRDAEQRASLCWLATKLGQLGVSKAGAKVVAADLQLRQ